MSKETTQADTPAPIGAELMHEASCFALSQPEDMLVCSPEGAVVIAKAIINDRQRRTTPAPEHHVVGIKPLEWEKVALDSANFNWLTIAYAETPFGRYEIDKHTKGFLRVMFGAQRVGHFEPDQRAEAEASAQSDFEGRILSALASEGQAE